MRCLNCSNLYYLSSNCPKCKNQVKKVIPINNYADAIKNMLRKHSYIVEEGLFIEVMHTQDHVPPFYLEIRESEGITRLIITIVPPITASPGHEFYPLLNELNSYEVPAKFFVMDEQIYTVTTISILSRQTSEIKLMQEIEYSVISAAGFIAEHLKEYMDEYSEDVLQ